MDSPMALLDSGATHALRAAESEKEWLESELVKVTLAGGQSVNMRMNAASKTEKDQVTNMPIIPMGELVQTLGYKMEWVGRKCKLVSREGGDHSVECPSELPGVDGSASSQSHRAS